MGHDRPRQSAVLGPVPAKPGGEELLAKIDNTIDEVGKIDVPYVVTINDGEGDDVCKATINFYMRKLKK